MNPATFTGRDIALRCPDGAARRPYQLRGIQDIRKESESRNKYGRFNSMKGNRMRRIIIAFVCVMIAPLAFAQTKKTKVQQTAATQPAATTETATSSTAGTVRRYEPGKTMMIDMYPRTAQLRA